MVVLGEVGQTLLCGNVCDFGLVLQWLTGIVHMEYFLNFKSFSQVIQSHDKYYLSK